MKSPIKSLPFSSSPIFLAVAVMMAYAAPQAPDAGVSVMIGTASGAVKVGTDVAVHVILRNMTDHVIRLTTPRAEAQCELVLDVEVRRDNGLLAQETKGYRDLRYARELSGQPVGRRESEPVGPTHKVRIPEIILMSRTLKAGAAWEGRLDIDKLYDLSAPGTYTISVRYLGPETKTDARTTVQSNTITVAVQP
jgi:hypothetical protein